MEQDTLNPGQNYSNWITQAKERLKVITIFNCLLTKVSKRMCAQIRDRTLLGTKITRITAIVKSFSNNQTFRISQTIIDNALQILNDKIDAWKGVNTRRAKGTFTEYKQYFDVGKKWYDGVKSKMLGSILWVPMFNYIRQVCICVTFL